MMKLKNRLAALAGAALLSAVLAGCAAGMNAASAPSSSMTSSGTDTMMDSSMTSADAAKAGYTKITAEEGKKMLDAGGVTLVDVRTAEEFAAGHIEGAINVANESIGTEMPEALPDKDATILVYCRSGRRSADAAAKLTAIGYTHVYDMGGIIDWPYGTVQ
jgi:rhodanese-related sulfurtransferase